MQIPDVPRPLLAALIKAAGRQRCALVGGAVRDLLLHRHHQDPWRGLPDLDVVVEGRAADLVASLPQALAELLGESVPVKAWEHDRFGTLQLEVVLPAAFAGSWLLDVASARSEVYLQPAENPQVSLGLLDDDLARRDFTVNAMALELATGVLIDPHGGQADLAARRLRFLHPHSLRDDPTRLLRGARYAARLGFSLAEESRRQAFSTLAAWPWLWRPGDPPGEAPPALGTRLRMELALLLERENWRQGLLHLQGWGGLVLLDPALQADGRWRRRLHWATRLGLPLMAALVAGAADPLALAERLQLPHRQHRLLAQLLDLRRRLAGVGLLGGPGAGDALSWPPSRWCALLEEPGLSPEAVALALACGDGPRRPLLRWLLRWRQVRAPLSAAALIAQGVPRGPELGRRLRQHRAALLDAEPGRPAGPA